MLDWRNNDRVARAAAALLLLAIVAVVYCNSFGGTFEGDSPAMASADPRVQQATLENVKLILTKDYWYPNLSSGLFRPVVTLTYLFNHAILGNGDNAFGYHVFNFCFHLLNVLLAFHLCWRVWGRTLAAFFTTAIFALHPVNVETVTNIAGRPDLLAGTAVLAGLNLHAGLANSSGWRRGTRLVGLTLVTFLGVFSKETAAALPAVMLLYDVVFRFARPIPWRRLLPPYVAVAPALVAMIVIRHAVLSRIHPPSLPFLENPLFGADFITARLTAVQILLRYLRLLLWPRLLSMDYSYNQIPMVSLGAGLLSLAAVLSVFALAAWLWRRHRPACFFIMFFFLTLGPASNLIVLIGSIMAERFLYLPSLGFGGAMVALALWACRLAGPVRARWAATALLAAGLAALGLRTYYRNLEWTDGDLLWSSTLQACPNSYKAHLLVTAALSRRPFDPESLDWYIEATEQAISIIAPLPPQHTYSVPLKDLAILYGHKARYLESSQPDEARRYYQKIVATLLRAIPIDAARIREWTGVELARGTPPDQITRQGDPALYEGLGDAYFHLGQFDKARDAFYEALRIGPSRAELYSRVAQVESQFGRRKEAMIARWAAAELDPATNTSDLIAWEYRALDPHGCAPKAALTRDLRCPLVRSHLCAAQRMISGFYTESNRPAEAQAYGRKAAATCPGQPRH